MFMIPERIRPKPLNNREDEGNKEKDREFGANIIGVGDNGREAVHCLMREGFKGIRWLGLHRNPQNCYPIGVDVIATYGSWAGIENVMLPFGGEMPKSVLQFYRYRKRFFQPEKPSFVLADFAELVGRDAAPVAAADSYAIAVVAIPSLEKIIAPNALDFIEAKLYWRFQSLCQHTSVVIAMDDDVPSRIGEARNKAMAKRQSDFVGDLLHSIQGGANAALHWQEVEKFFSEPRRWGRCNLWRAWSSVAGDVRSAMADVRRALSCGGALEEAKRVFLMITGKDGEFSLMEVQDVVDALTAALDEEAEVMLHVNCEKEFADGVRVNMAVRLDAG